MLSDAQRRQKEMPVMKEEQQVEPQFPMPMWWNPYPEPCIRELWRSYPAWKRNLM